MNEPKEMHRETETEPGRRLELRSGRSWVALFAVAVWPALALMASAMPLHAASPGELLWVDLITEDAETAVDFYRGLLDWRIEKRGAGRYTVLVDGEEIAGISEIEDRLEESEAMWLIGLASEDLSTSVAAARRLGAEIHVEQGRARGFADYAIIEDPEGAPLVLLDPVGPLGVAAKKGAWIWSELWTDDIESAGDFYREVLGLDRSEVDLAGGRYPVFTSNGKPRAGLVEIEDDAVEPIWAPYLAVEDVTAIVERARDLGGRVLLEPDPEIHEGRVALLADPTGGAFFIYELTEENS